MRLAKLIALWNNRDSIVSPDRKSFVKPDALIIQRVEKVLEACEDPYLDGEAMASAVKRILDGGEK